MGTWDVGPFDNDDAADFADDLDDAPIKEWPPMIDRALAKVANAEERRGGHAVAVAAAAIVAAQCPNGEPTHPVYGPQTPSPPLPVDLRVLAVQAIDRVLGPDSELAESWSESARREDWHADVRRLRAVLLAGLRDPNQLSLPVDL